MPSLVTNLTVPFSPGNSEEIGLSLELDRVEPLVGNPAGMAIVRQYPPVDAELFVSRGEISVVGIVREYLEAEVVTFEQSTTANTSKIMNRDVTIVKDWAFDVSTGREVRNARFTPHLGTTLIESSKPITGGVIVTYSSLYKELEYIFDVEIVDKTHDAASGIIGDINMYTGALVAYYEGATATLILRPPRLTSATATESLEIYKVVSRVVVNDKGAWEKPENWPDDNDYEQYPSAEGPDVGDPYIEDERVHEVGLVDDFGRFTLQTRHTPNRQPFEEISLFKPPYKFSSSYAAEKISDPTCAVRYDPIISRLKRVYGFSDNDIGRFGCY